MSHLLSSSLTLFLAFLTLLPAQIPAQTKERLTVAAASDLSVVGPQLKEAFEKRSPGVEVVLVNGPSAALSQQIANGAPFDLFLSANAAYVDQLAASGSVLRDTVRIYAVGRLGIVWRDGGKHPLRELTTAAVHTVSLPNPKLAPYGVAAQEALDYGGLWSMVQPKVVYGENVKQALQFLDSGNADATITSDALLQGRGAELIPADWHKPITQEAGVVASSGQKTRARAFVDFLLSSDGQAILARFGFGSPPAK